ALFPDDELPLDRLQHLANAHAMQTLERKLTRVANLASTPRIERAIGDALRGALDLPLVDPLVAAWRTHPRLASVRRNGETQTLIELGPHEVSSRHWPRVDVLCDSALLVSFAFDLRLELRVHSATLQVDRGDRVSRAWVEGCSGKGSVSLEDHELASFESETLGVPNEFPLDLSLNASA